MDTGKEMFDSAWSDEPEAEVAPEGAAEAEQAAEAQPPEQEAEPPLEAEQAEIEAVEGEGEQPQEAEQQKRTPRVPLPELMSERDKRATAEAERNMLQKELEGLRKRVDELSRPQQAQEQPGQDQEQGFWDNPEGYMQRMHEQVQRETRQRDFEWAMRLGETRYPDEFKEAYAFVDKQVDIDPSIRVKLVTSQDPAETIIQTYRQHKVAEEVGDPTQYREKLLSDPEFLAKAVEAAQAQARQQQSQPGQSAPNVQIPPSLSRTTGAAHQGDPDERPMSGPELFQDAFSGLRQA